MALALSRATGMRREILSHYAMVSMIEPIIGFDRIQ